MTASRWLILSLVFLASAKAGSPGRAPLAVIAQEGKLAITDGISLFILRAGGAFEAISLYGHGRQIEGKWRARDGQAGTFDIDGEWLRSGKIRVPKDLRRMTLIITSVSARKMVYRQDEAYESEFRIADLRPVRREVK